MPNASCPRNATANYWPRRSRWPQAEGLSAVTLRRVAADLGVTPGLVSHYFSSAEQLITAAFRSAAVADLAEARSHIDAAPTALAKMDALMDYVLDDSSDDAERAVAGGVEPGPAQRRARLRGQGTDRRMAGVHRRHRARGHAGRRVRGR